MDDWLTVAEMADLLDVTPVRVERLLAQLGMRDTVAHARGDGATRSYSPAVVALIGREVRSRGGR